MLTIVTHGAERFISPDRCVCVCDQTDKTQHTFLKPYDSLVRGSKVCKHEYYVLREISRK